MWDDDDKAVALITSMRIAAAEIIEIIPEGKRTEFAAIMDAFERKYGSKHVKEKLNERIQDYATEIERLANLAYIGVLDDVPERLKIDAFVKGLRDAELKKAVWTSPKTTFSETFGFALTQEATSVLWTSSMKVRCTEVSTERDISDVVCAAVDKSCAKINKCRLQKHASVMPAKNLAILHGNAEQSTKNHIPRHLHGILVVPAKYPTNRPGQRLTPVGITRPMVGITQSKRSNSSLTIDGKIQGCNYIITLDIGASHSIINSAIVKVKFDPLVGAWFQTATGEEAVIKGKIMRNISISDVSMKHKFLMADIMHEVILGMDFMAKHTFLSDMKRQLLQYANVTLPLTVGYDIQAEVLQVIVQRQQKIPPKSEGIMWATATIEIKLSKIWVVEPSKECTKDNIIIGKAVVSPVNKSISVRILPKICRSKPAANKGGMRYFINKIFKEAILATYFFANISKYFISYTSNMGVWI
uniref:Peptidase A2 domain-containing protein n=1 Tax=Glossina pallidipes TaxID=7398 RepID=A0A1A9ZHR1_GLOPL